MIFFILTAILLSNQTNIDLQKNSAQLAKQTHLICLSFMPKNIAKADPWKSIVCGEKITDQNLNKSLIQSSLIHIFIVSGSHLILIDQLLSFLSIPILFRIFFLSLYSLATLFQPPCVRSLVVLILQFLMKRTSYHQTSTSRTLFGGLITLCLSPSWVESRSFLMSWTAALSVGQGYSRHPVINFVMKCSMTFLFMIPLIWGFSPLHPIGIVTNVLIAPFIALILFPLGIASSFMHFLSPLFDQLISLLKFSISPVQELTLQTNSTTIPIQFLWIYLFSLQIFFHFYNVLKERGRT